MTGAELAKTAESIARNFKTAYIWGGFGAPITAESVTRAERQYSKNVTAGYGAKARKLISTNAFYFDCVGLIKAILWGWNGDRKATYGGARYASNGVPDISADAMIGKCSGVSVDFSGIKVGEALWCSGHIGIYIGDGLAVEATPSFAGGVQVTAVANMGVKAGYSARTWAKHGNLPWVTYAYTGDRKTVQEKTGFSDATMEYLNAYAWADDLFRKLAKAMK
jgi:hypothetical protein